MIVNRIRADLSLSCGPASKALLLAAGPSLQDECNKYKLKNEELTIGDFLVTGGWNLCCLYVFHVNLPYYTNRNSLKVSVFDTYLEQIRKTVYHCVCVCVRACVCVYMATLWSV